MEIEPKLHLQSDVSYFVFFMIKLIGHVSFYAHLADQSTLGLENI